MPPAVRYHGSCHMPGRRETPVCAERAGDSANTQRTSVASTHCALASDVGLRHMSSVALRCIRSHEFARITIAIAAPQRVDESSSEILWSSLRPSLPGAQRSCKPPWCKQSAISERYHSAVRHFFDSLRQRRSSFKAPIALVSLVSASFGPSPPRRGPLRSHLRCLPGLC